MEIRKVTPNPCMVGTLAKKTTEPLNISQLKGRLALLFACPPPFPRSFSPCWRTRAETSATSAHRAWRKGRCARCAGRPSACHGLRLGRAPKGSVQRTRRGRVRGRCGGRVVGGCLTGRGRFGRSDEAEAKPIAAIAGQKGASCDSGKGESCDCHAPGDLREAEETWSHWAMVMNGHSQGRGLAT